MKQKITLSVHLMLELLTSCLAALSSDHLLEEASTLGGCGERNAGEGCLIRPAEVAESMINNVFFFFFPNQWGKYKTWVPWNTQKGPLSYPSPSSLFSYRPLHFHGFPGGSDGKESACNVRSLGSIPGSGRSKTYCQAIFTHCILHSITLVICLWDVTPRSSFQNIFFIYRRTWKRNFLSSQCNEILILLVDNLFSAF